MPVADFLEKVAGGLEDGAKTVGRVAGAVAEPLGKAVVNEEAGYAPQIAAEGRQHQQAMDDAQIGAKAKVLESQLGQLQSNTPLFNNDGTPMTPQQRSQALAGITDQYTQLYSHPKHAPMLMEALRKAVHPNGAVAGADAAPSPAKAMGGFTAAAPPGYDDQQAQMQKEKEFQAQLQFFDKTIAPHLNPTQVAQKRNEFIDHLAGIKEPGVEKPPKGLKAMEQGGVFFGVEDQDTGKQYLKQQLEAGGDAPAEAKQMYAAVQKAAADKQAQADKKDAEINERQQRQFEHSLTVQTMAIQKAITIGDYREARKEVTKADESYQASVDRASTMDKAAIRAKQGDQQAQFAVLSNHIAMTLQQPGVSARPTKAMFDEAAGSLPWMQSITKKFDSDGYLVGITLSPDQIDKMTALGHEKVDTQRDHVERVKGEYQQALQPEGGGGGSKPKKGGVAAQLKPPAAAPKHKIKIGDKKYTYNGSGDTADLKNYTEVK